MDNNKFKMQSGTVSNVNAKKLANGRFVVLRRIVIGTLITGFIILGANALINKPKEMPETNNEVITMVVDLETERGDTFWEIGQKYYNEDCQSIYGSLDEYVKAIKKANGKEDTFFYKNDFLAADTTISLPVVVDKDNEYLSTKPLIEQKIQELVENEYWVDYVVKYGDTVSSLAELASSSYDETEANEIMICEKNNISKSDSIKEGQHLKIINPKLGELRWELRNLEDTFMESLENAKTK